MGIIALLLPTLLTPTLEDLITKLMRAPSMPMLRLSSLLPDTLSLFRMPNGQVVLSVRRLSVPLLQSAPQKTTLDRETGDLLGMSEILFRELVFVPPKSLLKILRFPLVAVLVIPLLPNEKCTFLRTPFVQSNGPAVAMHLPTS